MPGEIKASQNLLYTSRGRLHLMMTNKRAATT